MKIITSAAALVAACTVLAACSSKYEQEYQAEGYDVGKDRDAIALVDDWYGDSADKIVYLDQNWSAGDSTWFYFTTQGSELLPYNHFVNLEQIDSEALFIDPMHMARYRYLPQKISEYNPSGLPVGFVRNNDAVGLTCAACHTAQINYKGTAIRVDGAPAMSDFVGFVTGLESAVKATLDDDAKFGRFAIRVLGSAPRENDVTQLREALRGTYSYLNDYNTRNHSKLHDGFARVDAVGRIFNQVIKFTSDGAVALEPNAPVSYPFLWDTPQHDWVQWVGLTSNAGPGALGRNVGEVVGVFGRVDVTNQRHEIEKFLGYDSTVDVPHLVEMEEWVRRLESPAWPEKYLSKINRKLASQGEELYEQRCVKCHKLIDPRDPKREIRAQMWGLEHVKTDPTEAMNAINAVAPTGVLKGAKMPGGAGEYGDHAPVAVMLADLVEGILVKNVDATAKAVENAVRNGNGLKDLPKEGKYPSTINGEESPFASLLAYKARPLNGIWATAPYLHNGAVPTLYDLLLPEEERPQTFTVGRMEFDPVKVGFVHAADDAQAPFVYDTTLPGNLNTGHNFTSKLTEDERWALVEYLKTL